ncbi:HD domain-containing protein [Patescibacteria group bacterium]|nr:HD domain-containing protein [Patescibacteria group bacterium]
MHSTLVCTDRLYGTVAIDSPTMAALVASAPMQRLLGVCQFGIPDEWYNRKNFSRYEHCLGVMLLLRRLGASEEEQIAGLLHDVSHTAFSHVVDWLLHKELVQDFQDEQLLTYLQRSGLNEILEGHGFDPARIANGEHFPLLEQPAPDLCADRVDYALREFDAETVRTCLAGLTVHNGRMVCKNKATANLFARNYLQQDVVNWSGFESQSRYHFFVEMLQRALEKEIITFDDFWGTDAEVMEKVIASGDERILQTLTLLQQKSLAHYPPSDIVLHNKFRFVDPLVLINGQPVRLSNLDPTYQQALEDARQKNTEGVRLPKVGLFMD